jgi:anthranilate synthase component 2
MLLMIDNYDSFTYNLVQYLRALGASVRTVRNDALNLEALAALGADRLVVSPGPCTPNEAGVSLEAIRHFAGKIPILGVCLGHQAIGQAFGGKVVRAKRVMHGKASTVSHNGSGVFLNLPTKFSVIRYHSLAIDRESLPACLEISAHSDDGEIMGLRHRSLEVEGIQFHPESIETEHGMAMLENFLRR